MTPFTTFLVGSAAALLLAPAPSALAGTPAPDIHLTCPGGMESAFCRALAGALAPSARAVTLAQGPLEPADGVLLRFVSERSGPSVLAGHLTWRTGDGSRGRGPTLELSVMDASLNDALLSEFAAAVLHHSNLPI